MVFYGVLKVYSSLDAPATRIPDSAASGTEPGLSKAPQSHFIRNVSENFVADGSTKQSI